MLNRLYGISTLERSWLPKAGAVVLLCSTGLAPAVAQEAPRRLPPEATAAVVPVIHTADSTVKRLPPVLDTVAPSPTRMAHIQPPRSANPNIGWSMPGGSTASAADQRVKRLPPVDEVAALASAADQRVKRLPPVDEVASSSTYTPPRYTPPSQAASPRTVPASLPRQRDVSSYTPPTYTPPSYTPPTESSRFGSSPLPTAVPTSVKPYAPDSSEEVSQQAPTPQQARELQAVSARADALVRRGFSMAGRGAIYSARADFTEALSMIAQTVDRQQKSDRHVQALALGLRAINEAEHFQPIGSELGADIDVASLVASHRTDVLKDEASEGEVMRMTLSEARDRYHAYASEQLAIASGDMSVASLALYGLGKVRESQATERPTLRKIHFPAAMALYEAAVLVDGQNFRATNELGVLSARLGRHEKARAALQLSVATSPTKETWRNLAVVHQQLGEVHLAQQALNEAARTPAMNAPGNAHPALASSNVRWVSPQAFAQAGAANVAVQNPPAPSATRPSTTRPAPAAAGASLSMSKWLPWMKR